MWCLSICAFLNKIIKLWVHKNPNSLETLGHADFHTHCRKLFMSKFALMPLLCSYIISWTNYGCRKITTNPSVKAVNTILKSILFFLKYFLLGKNLSTYSEQKTHFTTVILLMKQIFCFVARPTYKYCYIASRSLAAQILLFPRLSAKAICCI